MALNEEQQEKLITAWLLAMSGDTKDFRHIELVVSTLIEAAKEEAMREATHDWIGISKRIYESERNKWIEVAQNIKDVTDRTDYAKGWNRALDELIKKMKEKE